MKDLDCEDWALRAIQWSLNDPHRKTVGYLKPSEACA